MQAGPQRQATARRVALLQRAIQQNPRLAQLFQATTTSKQPRQPTAPLLPPGVDQKYAPLARLPGSGWKESTIPHTATVGNWYADYDGGPAYWREGTPDKTVREYDIWNVLGGRENTLFQSKYFEGVEEADNGNMLVARGLQRPGEHKYNTFDAAWRKDPATGDYLLQGIADTKEQSSFKRHGPGVVSVLSLGAGGFAAPVTGALTSAGMNATAAGLLSNAMVNTGLSALAGARGSDLLRSGLAGAVAGGIGAYGQSAGWNPLATRIASRGAGSLISGRDPRSALIGAIVGQGGLSSGNAGMDSLLHSIIGQAITRRG